MCSVLTDMANAAASSSSVPSDTQKSILTTQKAVTMQPTINYKSKRCFRKTLVTQAVRLQIDIWRVSHVGQNVLTIFETPGIIFWLFLPQVHIPFFSRFDYMVLCCCLCCVVLCCFVFLSLSLGNL